MANTITDYSAFMNRDKRPKNLYGLTDNELMLDGEVSSIIPSPLQGSSAGDYSQDKISAWVGAGGGKDQTPSAGFDFKGLFGDEHMMGNLTGLAGTAMQAMALPQMLKNAKLQNKSLQFNLDTAKQEQAQRRKNISGFNSRGSVANPSNVQKSAFV